MKIRKELISLGLVLCLSHGLFGYTNHLAPQKESTNPPGRTFSTLLPLLPVQVRADLMIRHAQTLPTRDAEQILLKAFSVSDLIKQPYRRRFAFGNMDTNEGAIAAVDSTELDQLSTKLKILTMLSRTDPEASLKLWMGLNLQPDQNTSCTSILVKSPEPLTKALQAIYRNLPDGHRAIFVVDSINKVRDSADLVAVLKLIATFEPAASQDAIVDAFVHLTNPHSSERGFRFNTQDILQLSEYIMAHMQPANSHQVHFAQTIRNYMVGGLRQPMCREEWNRQLGNIPTWLASHFGIGLEPDELGNFNGQLLHMGVPPIGRLAVIPNRIEDSETKEQKLWTSPTSAFIFRSISSLYIEKPHYNPCAAANSVIQAVVDAKTEKDGISAENLSLERAFAWHSLEDRCGGQNQFHLKLILAAAGLTNRIPDSQVQLAADVWQSLYLLYDHDTPRFKPQEMTSLINTREITANPIVFAYSLQMYLGHGQ